MASNMSCRFAKLLSEIYPPRYGDCDGEIVALDDCQEQDEKGYSESYLILLRSGYG